MRLQFCCVLLGGPRPHHLPAPTAAQSAASARGLSSHGQIKLPIQIPNDLQTFNTAQAALPQQFVFSVYNLRSLRQRLLYTARLRATAGTKCSSHHRKGALYGICLYFS